MQMTRAQIVAMFGLTMTLDRHATIAIEDVKDNYDTLFVVTREGTAKPRRWGLPPTGGYSPADPVPVAA